jgi:hypothetical protein
MIGHSVNRELASLTLTQESYKEWERHVRILWAADFAEAFQGGMSSTKNVLQ